MTEAANRSITYTKGDIYPLGVKKVKESIHFSVAANHTEVLRLNIYAAKAKEKLAVIEMDKSYRTGSVFSVYVHNLPNIDLEYMYESNGIEWIDPYAARITKPETFGQYVSGEKRAFIRGVIINEDEMPSRRKPRMRIPYHEMILYRLHVRGFTMHSSSKVKHPGTFLGIKEKIPYLKKLGINAVELMPCYEFDEIIKDQNINPFSRYRSATLKKELEQFLDPDVKVKLNYWGYQAKSYYFAPKHAYAYKDSVKEMKQLIESLHKHGIDVILEMNFTQEVSQSLILDCLRYWVTQYGVDGFHLNDNVVSMDLIAHDPLLTDIKLLTHNVRTEYRENQVTTRNQAIYNEDYQNTVRRYLKGDEGQVSAFAAAFKSNPIKCAKINYITNTNGFTLADLYSYDIKHNEDNGEDNRDGTEFNYSWNCGVEGKSRRKKVMTLRHKQTRNALVTLFLSQGTPLLLAGDEFGNSQNGNNNAYCQDNEISWLNWNQVKSNEELLAFVRRLIALRKEHPILHKEEELRTMDYLSCGFPDLSFHGTKSWYADYTNYSRVLGIMLCGKYVRIDRVKEDAFFFFAYNMHWEDHEFDLPVLPMGIVWKVLIDTNEGYIEKSMEQSEENMRKIAVKARSIIVLRSQ